MQMLGIKAFPSLLLLGVFEEALHNPIAVPSHHSLLWGTCLAGREEAAEKLVSSVCCLPQSLSVRRCGAGAEVWSGCHEASWKAVLWQNIFSGCYQAG